MGRPPTGRTTKIVRVPGDMDVELAKQMYYDWLPIIEQAREDMRDTPRYYHLQKLLEQLKPQP